MHYNSNTAAVTLHTYTLEALLRGDSEVLRACGTNKLSPQATGKSQSTGCYLESWDRGCLNVPCCLHHTPEILNCSGAWSGVQHILTNIQELAVTFLKLGYFILAIFPPLVFTHVLIFTVCFFSEQKLFT